jgi:hypothetical protein
MRVLTLILLSACAPAAAQSVQYDGIAYDLDQAAVLYRESHFVARADDGGGERVVLYRCPDGQPFARKRIVYGADAAVPAFELLDARIGYREGVREQAGRREVFVQRAAHLAEKSGPLPDADGLVADAGFDEFVQRHWDELQGGATVRFPFLLPSKLDYFNFKVSKHHEEPILGVQASVFRLALGSWWAFLLPHIDVVYDTRARALLRFVGITNVRDAEGDNYKARIDFPPDSRRPLPADALGEALAVPLVSNCMG